MKLRNKKTGEIFEIKVVDKDGKEVFDFDNFEDGDFEPTCVPRLKDERFRKAVRAWFNLLPRLEDKRIFYENGALWVGVYTFDCGQYDLLNLWLKSGEYYTIEELCGEEGE